MNPQDILQRYKDEELPEYIGLDLVDVNQPGGFGNRPLNIACTRGSIEEVQALLDGGADPNLPGEDGCSPLHDAIGQGHARIVELLLRAGARTDIADSEGKTPLQRANLKRYPELKKALRS